MNITTSREDGWHVVAINGKFVVKHLTQIRKVFEGLEQSPAPQIGLDLTHTTHLDSSAITLLLNFQKRLLASGGKLVLFGPTEDVMGIFAIVRFDKAVPIFRTREQFEQTQKK